MAATLGSKSLKVRLIRMANTQISRDLNYVYILFKPRLCAILSEHIDKYIKPNLFNANVLRGIYKRIDNYIYLFFEMFLVDILTFDIYILDG